MKKIFTLIITATLFTTAFAQQERGRNNDNSYNKKEDNRLNDRNGFMERERNRQIMQINREYDYKIESIKDKLFMSRYKKARIIASLQDQRRNEIRIVYAKFNNSYGHYDGPQKRW